jgi:hypothetical protein
MVFELGSHGGHLCVSIFGKRGKLMTELSKQTNNDNHSGYTPDWVTYDSSATADTSTAPKKMGFLARIKLFFYKIFHREHCPFSAEGEVNSNFAAGFAPQDAAADPQATQAAQAADSQAASDSTGAPAGPQASDPQAPGAGIPLNVERDLRKLSRKELLELLLVQSRRIDRLEAQLEKANSKLADREIHIAKAGTMAEASLSLNGVFESIDAAGAQYLENLKIAYEREQHNIARLQLKEAALDAVITGCDPNIDPPTATYIKHLLEDAHFEMSEALLLLLNDSGQKELAYND